jgi:hypothetical protein
MFLEAVVVDVDVVDHVVLGWHNQAFHPRHKGKKKFRRLMPLI